MEDEEGEFNESVPSSFTSPSSSPPVNSPSKHVQSQSPPGESTENDPDEAKSKLHHLYEKYTIREREIDRLEKQNEEYREKLIRTLREREESDEATRLERKERNTRFEEQERKIMDYECQLKVLKDRSNAQELHFNKTTQMLTEKFNKQVNELTKKMEIAESEKNQSVVKYAMREAELMKLQAEAIKKDEEIKVLKKEGQELRESSSQQKLEDFERVNDNLNVVIERLKHDKFDLDNRLRMSEKRADASQGAIAELKQQIEVMRRQMITLKEDKSLLQDEYCGLKQRVQSEEDRLRVKEEKVNSEHLGKEELYKKIVHDAARAKEKNVELSAEIETLLNENTTLMGDVQEARDKLKVEEQKVADIQKKLEEMQGIERRVNGALEAERTATKAKEEAEADKETAENEAEECRKQAERMLEITESLTKRNTDMIAELNEQREKLSAVQQRLIEVEGAKDRMETNNSNTDRDISAVKTANEAEIKSLKTELTEKIAKVLELTTQLDEERNDASAYKKKAHAAIKELKSEASSLRRQLTCLQTPTEASSFELPPPPSTLASGSSRTSSITSIDQIGQIGKIREKEETQSLQSTQSAHSASPAEEPSAPAQQALIEKIVKLQKQLLRRNEKIEFLEEHVRQCLDELQKKTKIIQYYTLREEASLLLPADDSMQKLMECCEVVQVPIAKKTASSYALMGSIFTGGGGEKKAALQLTTEVNSRLQAVLEDCLLKNINLKDSVDKLGEEISRLSRENRRLALTQKTPS